MVVDGIAFETRLEFFWRRIGRRAEFKIAAASFAAARDQDPLTDFVYFLGQTGRDIRDGRTCRDLQNKIFSTGTIDELRAAIFAALGMDLFFVGIVRERIHIGHPLEIYRGAAPAVAARRAARESYSIERHGAAPALAGHQQY